MTFRCRTFNSDGSLWDQGEYELRPAGARVEGDLGALYEAFDGRAIHLSGQRFLEKVR